MKIPFGDAFLLLLYLLPGFLAMQLYRARYPARRAPQFEVIVWSVLHSFIVLLLLAGVARVVHSEGLDLLGRTSDSTVDAKMIATLLAGGSAWGAVLIGYHWCRMKLSFLPTPDPQAIWPIAAGDNPDRELWSLVRTKNGRLYLGWIEKYSFDPSAEDHDFLLRPAYVVNDELEIERDLVQGGVYLNTRDVESLERIPGA